MSATQSGNSEVFADGTVASPSVAIGRLDTGFSITRDSNGVPTGIVKSVAGAIAPDVSHAAAAPVDGVAASATVTDGNATNYDLNESVTIGGKTYTFKTALTPAEGEILIGATADDSLNNLVNAINKDGILGVNGTDFQVAAANLNVSAGAVGAHATVLTARTKGVAGNAITLTKIGAHGAVSGAHLAGGVDGTVGARGNVVEAAGAFYFCTADAAITDSGKWKKVTLGAL